VIISFVWVPSFLTSTFFVDPSIAAQGVTADGDSVNCNTAANAATAYCSSLGQLAQDLGWGITVAGIIVALIAPVLGQRADAAGKKKLMLGVFTGLLVLSLFGMAFIQGVPAFFWFGVTLLAAATVFAEVANVNYNALLNSVSNKSNVGRVSGLGWGFGYLGGIVALVIVVGAILGGVLDGTQSITFQIVAFGAAVWALVFSIPIFVSVPEPAATPSAKKVGFFAGYRELARNVAELWRHQRNTFWFLLASAVYRDGLTAVFTFGAIIASQVFGFGFTDMVIFGIALNIIAGISTMLVGKLDDRFGPKPVILVAIGALVVTCVGLVFGASGGTAVMWAAGIVIAIMVGPAQAASRSFLSRLAPEGREGEIFGLYATTGRAASWMGSALWALAIVLFANQTIFGALGIAALLAVGFVLLWFVKPPQRQHA
jgi:UMF1 family MFS transporter